MPTPPSPLDIAQTVARNLVPLGGILFLGWSADNVLLLYLVDTMLAMGVMFAGLARHFAPPTNQPGMAARISAEFGYVAVALFLAAFISIPLGMPVYIILAASDVSVSELFSDPAFRGGLVMQAIAAFWSGWSLYRALATHTPEELRLKRRFSLVFLRWVAVLMVAFSGFVLVLGKFASFVLVAVYAAASIMIDVAPDKFLRAMPGGAEDAEPLPGAASGASPQASWKARRKDKRKR
ncbi:MAG: hypothetical protein IT518_12335 [Burkholderiales bacterium]|nr:hypothetical protein [Burkholderiales bacterium]